MNELSDEVLEHAISYPQDLSQGNLQALLKELKERRALSVLGEAATTENILETADDVLGKLQERMNGWHEDDITGIKDARIIVLGKLYDIKNKAVSS